MEIDILYPAADLVLGKAMFCAACGKPTTAVQFHRESGTVKTNCKCDKGPHFQNILQQPAGVTA